MRLFRHAGVATVVALLAALLPLHAASAQAEPRIELASQTPWVRTDGVFDVSVTVAGAPPDATLDLLVDDRIEGGRRSLPDTFEGEDVNGGKAAKGRQPLPTLVDPTTNAYKISYPVGEGGAGIDDPGVYPAKVQLADAGGATLAELVTYILVLPGRDESVTPLSVGVVMDVGATKPGLLATGATNIDQETWTNLRTRTTILEETEPTPVTVVPVPETLDALGLGMGAEGEQVLAALREATRNREVIGGSYVDVDVGAMAAANFLGQVQPERDWGGRTVDRWLETQSVKDIWASSARIDETATEALETLGITQALVPSSAIRVRGVGTPTAPVALKEDGPLAVAADESLGERLLGQDGALDAQRFLAELFLIWQQSPDEDRGIVVRIPDSEPLDATVAIRALDGIAASGAEGEPVLQAVTLTDLFSRTPEGGEEEPAVVEFVNDDETPRSDLGTLPGALMDATDVVFGLATALSDTNLIDQLHRSLLIAPGRTTPDNQRMRYVRRVNDERAALASEINAPHGFTITLTARDGNIPLAIENTSDLAVNVRVHMSSSQLEFPDGDTFDLLVGPGGETENVPVRTRASGAFPLAVRITSPDGSVVFDQTTFTIRSTAVSGVGLVLSVGAGLFLLIWWARHWRTTRRAKKLVPAHAAGRKGRLR